MAFLKGERIVADEQKGMLPGVAGIAMWMLVVASVGVFGAINGVYVGHARYVVLPVCTMIVIGVFRASEAEALGMGDGACRDAPAVVRLWLYGNDVEAARVFGSCPC